MKRNLLCLLPRSSKKKNQTKRSTSVSLSPLSLSLAFSPAFPWKLWPIPSNFDSIRPIRRRSKIGQIPTSKIIEVSSPPSCRNRSESSDLRLLRPTDRSPLMKSVMKSEIKSGEYIFHQYSIFYGLVHRKLVSVKS